MQTNAKLQFVSSEKRTSSHGRGVSSGEMKVPFGKGEMTFWNVVADMECPPDELETVNAYLNDPLADGYVYWPDDNLHGRAKVFAGSMSRGSFLLALAGCETRTPISTSAP